MHALKGEQSVAEIEEEGSQGVGEATQSEREVQLEEGALWGRGVGEYRERGYGYTTADEQ